MSTSTDPATDVRDQGTEAAGRNGDLRVDPGRPADDMVAPDGASGVPGIVEAACMFSAARQRPAAVFVLAQGNAADDIPDEPITKHQVARLVDCLDDASGFEQLDLVVQSSGGDIHAAFQLMSLLRDRMADNGKLTVCVPSIAKSSATLLCLGGDEILLDDLGALGPLDAQIRTGFTDVGTPDYSSALHLFKGLTRLQELSREALWQTAAMLYDKGVRRDDEILKYSMEFARGLTAPLFERIESHKIGYWDQMLRTGEEYGRVLLERGDLIIPVPQAERDRHIGDIVRKLVYGYPSHECVIDRRQLADQTKGLGLRAGRFDVRQRAIAKDFRRYASDSLVMLVYPDSEHGFSSPSEEVSLHDWAALCDHGPRNVVWKQESHTFSMRVGIYGRRTEARNPWRGGSTPDASSDSARYFVSGADEPTF